MSDSLEPTKRSDVFITETSRRARGAYYTPDLTADLMAEWLVRSDHTVYGEPSFGDGALIEAVNRRAIHLGYQNFKWIASELSSEAAEEAVGRGSLTLKDIRLGDYLSSNFEPVEAIIANPPYVRLRYLDDNSRLAALESARTYLKEPMSSSASLWMPFVLKMVSSLKKGGRMAAVLPHDFTYLSYAIPLWKHLAKNFSSLKLIRTRQRLFPDINQDVVILLADGHGETTSEVECFFFEDIKEAFSTNTFSPLRGNKSTGKTVLISKLAEGDRVFQKALLPEAITRFFEESAANKTISPLSNYLKFRVGYISGDNSFFHPTVEVAKKYSLPKENLFPALIKNKKLKGQGLYTKSFDSTAVDHLWLPKDTLTAGEKKYVEVGIEKGVSNSYKARNRNPWYKVPGALAPQFLISVFSEKPLFLVNNGQHVNPTSMLGANLLDSISKPSIEKMVSAWYSPLTLLSIALEVRTLGGGVFNLIPGEVRNVQVVSPAAVALNDLNSLDESLKKGDISAAYSLGEKNLTSIAGKDIASLVQESLNLLSSWREKA